MPTSATDRRGTKVTIVNALLRGKRERRAMKYLADMCHALCQIEEPMTARELLKEYNLPTSPQDVFDARNSLNYLSLVGIAKTKRVPNRSGGTCETEFEYVLRDADELADRF